MFPETATPGCCSIESREGISSVLSVVSQLVSRQCDRGNSLNTEGTRTGPGLETENRSWQSGWVGKTGPVNQ